MVMTYVMRLGQADVLFMSGITSHQMAVMRLGQALPPQLGVNLGPSHQRH
jgi:hypothetical protein